MSACPPKRVSKLKPYYQESGVTIYCGDCRLITPHVGGFDVLFTDPPYGINGGKGSNNLKRGKGNYQSNFEDSPQYIKTVVAPFIAEQITKTRTVVLTPGNRCSHLYPQPDSMGCFYCPAKLWTFEVRKC